MPKIPTRQMTNAVRLCAEPGSHHRDSMWMLEHRPDGSWELYHYGSLLYLIDRHQRTQVFLPQGEEDMGLSKSDRDGINSLSMCVLGRMEIEPKCTMTKKRREELGL